MSIYILGPDQDGNCCTCAERINVCDTCVSCPPTGKMLLPPLTEVTDIWYANLAAAQLILAGDWAETCGGDSCNEAIVIGCIGYGSYGDTNPPQTTARTYSIAGTTSLAVAIQRTTTAVGNSNGILASINLVAGSILSVAWTTNTAFGGGVDSFLTQVSLFDSSAQFVQIKSFHSPDGPSPINGAGTFVFNVAAYTGRYIIRFSSVGGDGSGPSRSVTATFNATSDNTMSVNTITALYHTGADTPSCLNCT